MKLHHIGIVASLFALASCTHKSSNKPDSSVLGKPGPTTIEVTRPTMPEMDLGLDNPQDDTTE